MRDGSVTYNFLAFPVWVLHIPKFREELEEMLVLSDESPETRPLIQNEEDRWSVSEQAFPSREGPWWYIHNDVLGIRYDESQFEGGNVVEALNQLGVPHDLYQDTGPYQTVCDQLLGSLSGSACRRQGITALEEVYLPDDRVVKRKSDVELLAMLEANDVAAVQDHLKAVVSSLSLIPPLDDVTMDPHAQRVEAFVCAVANASNDGEITDFVDENPGIVESLSVAEKDRVLAGLCLQGENSALLELIENGFSIDAEAPRRVTQLLAQACEPSKEHPNATMLSHLSAVCVRNRALEVLSDMDAPGASPAKP